MCSHLVNNLKQWPHMNSEHFQPVVIWSSVDTFKHWPHVKNGLLQPCIQQTSSTKKVLCQQRTSLNIGHQLTMNIFKHRLPVYSEHIHTHATCPQWAYSNIGHLSPQWAYSNIGHLSTVGIFKHRPHVHSVQAEFNYLFTIIIFKHRSLVNSGHLHTVTTGLVTVNPFSEVTSSPIFSNRGYLPTITTFT